MIHFPTIAPQHRWKLVMELFRWCVVQNLRTAVGDLAPEEHPLETAGVGFGGMRRDIFHIQLGHCIEKQMGRTALDEKVKDLERNLSPFGLVPGAGDPMVVIDTPEGDIALLPGGKGVGIFPEAPFVSMRLLRSLVLKLK